MNVTVDLTERQTARLLEQALRNRARCSIEPRVWPDEPTLQGVITGREGKLLKLELEAVDADVPVHELIGSFCDSHLVLCGQLYMFSTCIIDVLESLTPPRLLMAMPDSIQLVNRRRFDRQAPASASKVEVRADGQPAPSKCELVNFSADGIAVRFTCGELDDLLLVGDEVGVSFELPNSPASFDVRVIVCNKTIPPGTSEMIVGFKFRADPDDPVARTALDQLRAVVCDAFMNTTRTEGDA